MEEPPREIYTDGSCLNNGKENAKCGSGVWFGRNDPLNKSIRIPGPYQSNQVVSPSTPIVIITDSRFVIESFTKYLHNWENKGWINIANSKLIRAIAYHLRIRSARTIFRWVKGHENSIGNSEADTLAGQGAPKETYDIIDTSIPIKFDLQGTQLTSITQALAYQDLSKKYQSFIYRTLNNSYKVGKFWLNIPTFEHRADCLTCREDIESIEHILTSCDQSPSKTIWKLAENIWPTNTIPWPQISIGTILGCGALKIPHTPNKNDPNDAKIAETKRGLSRLLRIIISESAYLIWVVRCKRVIQGTQHDADIISKRWINTLNNRLHIDRVLASKNQRNKKTIFKVQATWSKIVSDKKPLQNWVTALEVLVGITLPRPPQHEAT
ncbi:ribonuclease H-like protein [Suillus occidentalis]|nr:ribonuclease H-like protein [Suillus occidentalis]